MVLSGKKLCYFNLLFIQLFIFFSTSAQWRSLAPEKVRKEGQRWINPAKARLLEINLNDWENEFLVCPKEKAQKLKSYGKVIAIPDPNGGYQRFAFAEYELMEPGLKEKWSFIKSYTGQGIDNPTATCKVDFTAKGFHAMVLEEGKTWFIDPLFSENKTQYQVYFKSDFDPVSAGKSFDCQFHNTINNFENSNPIPESINNNTGGTRRVYRIAIAATAEYTNFHGGITQAASAITTSLNRVNGIYEKEVCIRMILVANNNNLIYTNANTDPYTNNNGGTMLNQNQANVNSVIGSGNYDIGHVFSTGGGGVAIKGSVCVASLKAMGVTGSFSPIGDPFDVDYVAHEIGHQFGGDHTFNSQQGDCAPPNREATSAFEPGSGSTIMAYAGLCGTDDTQNRSDPYFHFRSYEQITAFSNNAAGNSCPVKQVTGNTPPVVPAIPGTRVIPISTPFKLTAPLATDADGDTLTYCWEQNDLGPGATLNNPTGNAPLFRSFSPTQSRNRIFPRLNFILSNTSSLGERLPTTTRSVKFKLLVRDNNSGAGGAVVTTMQMTSDTAGGAFQVTSPNTNVTWEGGTSQNISWRRGKTHLAPFNSPRVRILLSTDGGQNFNFILKDTTQNDGAEIVQLPIVVSALCRIMVESVENVFFDVSNANFRIIEPSVANIGTTVSDTALCAGQSFQASVVPVGTVFNSGNVFTLQLSNAAGNFANPINIGNVTATGNAQISATIPPNTVFGTGYKMRIVSSNPVRTSTVIINAPKIKALPPTAGAISGPSSFCPNEANKVYTIAALQGVNSYSWQVPPGASIQGVSTGNSINVTFGNTAGNIQVLGVNGCGNGQPSSLPVGITVIQPAQVTISASATSLCEGTALQITGNPSNGGSAPLFTWLRNNQAIAGATTANLNFPNPSNGDRFALILRSSLTCGPPNVDTSNTVQVTVNPKRTPVSLIESNAQNDTSCTGIDITFTSTNNLAGGTNPQYAWFRNLNPIAGATTNTLVVNNLLSTDSVRLRLTVTGSCLTTNQVFSKGKKTAIINLNVNAGIDTSVCAGNSALLKGLPQGGTWSGPGVNGSGVFQGNTPGLVNLVYSYSQFGCFKTDSRAITVLANPQATYSVSGNNLTAQGSNVSSYRWFLNGNPIAGAAAGLYTINQTGEYCVELTYTNGCKSKSPCLVQVFVSQSELISEEDFSVFPNPATDEFMIRWKRQPEKIQLFNVLGKLIKEEIVSSSEAHKVFSLSNLVSGTYQLVFVNNGKMNARKTILKR
jgi:hypothetical protein